VLVDLNLVWAAVILQLTTVSHVVDCHSGTPSHRATYCRSPVLVNRDRHLRYFIQHLICAALCICRSTATSGSVLVIGTFGHCGSAVAQPASASSSINLFI
jgi:hypothetical protein